VTPHRGLNGANHAEVACIPGKVRRVATGTPATALLAKAKVAFTLHPYEHDARAEAFGDEAAQALGVAPERIFKTLIATVYGGPPAKEDGVGGGGKLACGVVPVSGRLDLKALAAAVGGKRAELADPAAAARATGYVLGGISPLGQKSRLPVVVDESASAFETVYVSAGRRGLQVEVAPADLVRLSRARLARISAS
jgi:Cys-tRNA(Pro)/Cys-tRNA(Cys) deacylase